MDSSVNLSADQLLSEIQAENLQQVRRKIPNSTALHEQTFTNACHQFLASCREEGE